MDVPYELKEALCNDKLVIFVGSGLSRAVGHPTWKGLVLDLLESSKDRIDNATVYSEAVKADIFDPLEALEKLKTAHKKTIYEHFQQRLSAVSQSEIHKKLGSVSSKIITTNYDKIIEHNIPTLTIIDNTSDFNLSKLDTISSYLLKIHGDITRPDSCIIFNSDYENLYKRDTLAKYQLEKIFSNHTCLFMGFSFTDPYVTTLFEKVSELYGGYGPQHYIISTAKVKYEGIKTIEITNHDHLETYIEQLTSIKIAATQIEPSDPPPALHQANNDILLRNFGTDTPPNVEYWVGRETELKLLTAESDFKVIFITGFGGQGKSSLAAYYTEICKASNKYSLTDWRDFKEEDHNFDLKIASIIEKITSGRITVSALVGLDSDTLIKIFFKELGGQSCLFVFDNVDSYIDLETFEPVGSIGKLFNAAFNTPHNSKFIFTCRPVIHYADIKFFQLKIAGLTLENVFNLFDSAKLPISPLSVEKLVTRAFSLTDGHALWVSLILAQAKRGQKNVENFLDNIERKNIVNASESTRLSTRILREIWDSLNDKQKILLRTLAEAVTSESEEEISKIIGSELNFNQFSKSLRTLKDLHLIVTKGDDNYIELHPLVKEFIKYNFPNHEQKKFISLFIRYYDQFIVLLKPRLNQILGLDEFKTWSHKIELLINNSEYGEAVNSLVEIEQSINRSGFTEEYVRLSCALLEKISWTPNKRERYDNFIDFLNSAITAISQYGDKESASKYLAKFEEHITTKNNDYIFLLSTKTNMHWFNNEYEKAIKYGEEADYLITQTGEQDKWDARHRLNLAYRDSGIPENVEKSLQFF